MTRVFQFLLHCHTALSLAGCSPACIILFVCRARCGCKMWMQGACCTTNFGRPAIHMFFFYSSFSLGIGSIVVARGRHRGLMQDQLAMRRIRSMCVGNRWHAGKESRAIAGSSACGKDVHGDHVRITGHVCRPLRAETGWPSCGGGIDNASCAPEARHRWFCPWPHHDGGNESGNRTSST